MSRLPSSSATAAPLTPAALGLAGFLALAHVSAGVDALSASGQLATFLWCVAAVFGGWVWLGRRGVSRGEATFAALLALSLSLVWALSRSVGLPGTGGAAPVGPLDTVAFVDDLLLAVVCLRIRREAGRAGHGAQPVMAEMPSGAPGSTGGNRLRGKRLRGGGDGVRMAGASFVAVGLSLMLLSMGCGIGTAGAGRHWSARSGPSVDGVRSGGWVSESGPTLFCHLL